MDVDSCCTPPPLLDSLHSLHSSPTPPLSEIQSETKKAREIIGGIKLCRIWVDPLDKGQVCYQGDSRFRILKMNWRREAELRRMAATASEKGVTQSGNETTQPPQSAPVVSSSHNSHSSKKPSSTKNNTDSSSTSRMNATRKGAHTTSNDLSRRWKHTNTFRIKKKRDKTQSQIDSGEFPAAIPTIWNCQEALACPMEGCGTHFSRQTDYIRHMRTVHRRAAFVCRECGRSVSRYGASSMFYPI